MCHHEPVELLEYQPEAEAEETPENDPEEEPTVEWAAPP
jgi:hypothetical protein